MAQRYPDDSVGEESAATGIGRRGLLRWALALGATGMIGAGLIGSTGCSVSDPRIEPAPNPDPSSGTTPPRDPGQPPDPEPTPTPTFAGAGAAAESERRLAGLAAAALTGPWRQGLGDRADLFAAIRDGHLAHATALQGDQPTTRPTENPAKAIEPPKAPKSLAAALDLLGTAERAQAARNRTAALGTTGLAALLWGSMSVAATTYAGAIDSRRTVPIGKVKPPKPSPLLSDVEAMQQLVTQLHALNFGYPLAIGQLVDGPRRNSAIRQLRSRRGLRDSLVATLQTRKATIPVPAAAYVPTVFPRSNATAVELVQDLESRLAPFAGLWLAAAPTLSDRTRAFDDLALTVATARTWGAPLKIWPGWIS